MRHPVKKFIGIKYMPGAVRRKYVARYNGIHIGSAENFEDAYRMLLEYAADRWGSVDSAKRYIAKYFILEEK